MLFYFLGAILFSAALPLVYYRFRSDEVRFVPIIFKQKRDGNFSILEAPELMNADYVRDVAFVLSSQNEACLIDRGGVLWIRRKLQQDRQLLGEYCRMVPLRVALAVLPATPFAADCLSEKSPKRK